MNPQFINRENSTSEFVSCKERDSLSIVRRQSMSMNLCCEGDRG